MGRKGPAAHPVAIQRRRGKQPLKAHTLAPTVASPELPTWLTKGGQFAWSDLVPLLIELGVLSRIDGNALARYCHLWDRWRKAEDFLLANGEVCEVRDDEGRVVSTRAWPQVDIAFRLAQALLRLEQEFGMTPSARSRIRDGTAQQATMMQKLVLNFYEAQPPAGWQKPEIVVDALGHATILPMTENKDGRGNGTGRGPVAQAENLHRLGSGRNSV